MWVMLQTSFYKFPEVHVIALIDVVQQSLTTRLTISGKKEKQFYTINYIIVGTSS